jgi:hypothetical protein
MAKVEHEPGVTRVVPRLLMILAAALTLAVTGAAPPTIARISMPRSTA